MVEKNDIEIAKRLASRYGEEMMLYGKSLYWTSPRSCPDTTDNLISSSEFHRLPKDFKDMIIKYGNDCKLFGMGCYQENGAAAIFYRKCHAILPPNPFNSLSLNDVYITI